MLKYAAVASLGVGEVRLAVPERVVGIERYDAYVVEFSHYRMSFSETVPALPYNGRKHAASSGAPFS